MMKSLKKYILKIKVEGWKKVIGTSINYRREYLYSKIMRIICRFFKLKNTIVLESHNDFDCNAGAFYEYLIKNRYNVKYKIVWLLKNSKPFDLPNNVYSCLLYKPSWRKTYYLASSKYLLFDNVCIKKIREDQITLYLSHGAFGLKDTHGVNPVGSKVDYLVSPSPNVDEIMAYQWSLPFPTKKIVHLGFPSEDILYTNFSNEFEKITHRKYSKILLWMPTFRKLKNNDSRQDAYGDYPYGLPLITSKGEYSRLNKILANQNILLVIKLHPMQDLESISELNDTENIKWLDALKVKQYNLDIYRLLYSSDALLSDYSSVAYSFLHCDKPIGYVLSDLDSYKRGICVKEADDYMAGDKIINMNDLISFIHKIVINQDEYVEKRKKLLDFIYEYHDGYSCKRIVDFLHLKL